MRNYFLCGKHYPTGYMLYLYKNKKPELLDLGKLKLSKPDFSIQKGNKYIPFSLPKKIPDQPVRYQHYDDDGYPEFAGNFCLGDFYIVKFKKASWVRSHGVFLPWYDYQSGRLQEPAKKCVDDFTSTGERVTLVGEAVLMPCERLENKIYGK